MNRRTVFKHLASATAAAWILPACVSDPKKVSVTLNRLKVTGEEEELLAAIAGVIIPATDTPGAVEVKAHQFALVMVDDCFSKENQEKYLAGMRSFEDTLRTLTGQQFVDASAADRLEILTAFEGQLDQTTEKVRYFYDATRDFVIDGYLSSQHFLTEVKPYQLVPGPYYNGCVPVVNTNTIS